MVHRNEIDDALVTNMVSGIVERHLTKEQMIDINRVAINQLDDQEREALFRAVDSRVGNHQEEKPDSVIPKAVGLNPESVLRHFAVLIGVNPDASLESKIGVVSEYWFKPRQSDVASDADKRIDEACAEYREKGALPDWVIAAYMLLASGRGGS